MASEGPNYPATEANDNTVGTNAWDTLGNADADDATYSNNTGLGGDTSQYLKATDYGFSIPSGATIDGVVGEIDVIGNSRISDNAVRLVIAGSPTGDNKALGGTWSSGVRTYGGSSDTWGLSPSDSDVNGSGFGLAIAVNASAGEGTTTAFIDYMRLTVYYTEAAGGGNTAPPPQIIIWSVALFLAGLGLKMSQIAGAFKLASLFKRAIDFSWVRSDSRRKIANV